MKQFTKQFTSDFDNISVLGKGEYHGMRLETTSCGRTGNRQRNIRLTSYKLTGYKMISLLLVLAMLCGFLPTVPVQAKVDLAGAVKTEASALTEYELSTAGKAELLDAKEAELLTAKEAELIAAEETELLTAEAALPVAEASVPEYFSSTEFRADKAGKDYITLKWGNVYRAKSYVIHLIGPSAKLEQVTVTDANVTSYRWEGLKKNTYYSFYLEAYTSENAEGTPFLRSPRIYEATTGGKYTNPGAPVFGPAMFTKGSQEQVKIITGNKRFIDVDTGVTDLSAYFLNGFSDSVSGLSLGKLNSGRRADTSAAGLVVRNVRYESSEPNIATVSEGQMLTAVHKGSCELYAYALNGKYVKVKVTAADAVAEDELKEYGGYSLQNIAELNNTTVDKLTVRFENKSDEILIPFTIDIESLNEKCFEDAQYIAFLGESFTEKKVTNETEAEEVLDTYLTDLLGLQLVKLEYIRTEISGVTDNRYYSFTQVRTQEYEGEQLIVQTQLGYVKLIVDNGGNVLGISSNLVRESYFDTTEYRIFSREEVIEWAYENAEEGWEVYDELTHIGKLYDASLADITVGRLLSVWYVYVSEIDYMGRKKYALVTVPVADVQLTNEITCATVNELYSESDLGEDDLVKINMRLFDERDFEDAGTVTCEVDYSKFVKSKKSALRGKHTVTVPIMKEKSTGNYILGSMEDRILVCNATDTYMIINRVVTDDPSDINSWHFEYEHNPIQETGIDYFCDPNFIFGSYSTLINVSKSAEELFGDVSELPMLLRVYACDEMDYPENEDDFNEILSSWSYYNGWNTIQAQPNDEACFLLVDCMGHEYSHGYEQERTESIYANESGAVLEAYANILGNAIEIRHTGEESWYFMESAFDIPWYDLSDPYYSLQPCYVDDIYYVPPIEGNFKYWDEDADGHFYVDYGGAHINSTVMTYLNYRMADDSDLLEGEQALSIEKDARLWYETTYMETADRTFENIACLLSFAGKLIGLNEYEQAYVDRLIFDHGLAGTEESRAKLESIMNQKEMQLITVHFSSEDESIFDENLVAVVFDARNSADISVSNTTSISGRRLIYEDEVPVQPVVVLLRKEDAKAILMADPFSKTNASTEEDYYVDIEMLELGVGEEYLFPDNVLAGRGYNDLHIIKDINLIENKVIFEEAAIYNIITHSDDMAPNEAKLYIVFVE